MSHPDPALPIDQSQQQGGVNLGAFNQFRDVKIGDLISGDKITNQIFQLIVYTGEPSPRDPAMRTALLRAYHSEIALRYAQWRRRYATLPLVALPVANQVSGVPHYEREELFFAALRRDLTAGQDEATAQQEPVRHTFTDLREGLDRYGHMLLLGPPGGGKTTALWRLALDLAEAGLAGADVPLPVFVRLGGLQPGQSLRDLLHADMASAAFVNPDGLRFPLEAHRTLAGLLDELLANGHLVLLWDGLNEVPRSRFVAMAQELDTFRRTYPGRIEGSHNTSITTCRADDHALLIEECGHDPYPVQGVRIEGLDSATIRQVVVGLLGTERGATLLTALATPDHATLAGLARTPLLLTMLCEVYGATGELPRNRGQLLQRFVSYRWTWEQQRHPEGWIAAEVQERALARLAYAMTESSGRGTSVQRPWAEQHIRAAGGISDPAQLLRQAQAADLVEWLSDGSQLRFTHQLVQEYFAAVALRTKLQAATRWGNVPMVGGLAQQRLLRQYARPDARTGWEETLLLLAGLEDDAGLARALIRSFVAQPLQAAKLLTADSGIIDPGLRDEICAEALRQLAAQPFQRDQRLNAGRALGLLGDPRFPVRHPEWQVSLTNLSTGLTDQGDHYWRYVPAGHYRIGGWEKQKPSAEHKLDPFWIARLPITVAQFARFVTEGYLDDIHWTAHGLAWRGERTAPYAWDDPRYTDANQPVVNITWYEATAFCRWLTTQLAVWLPAGHVIRLPTEAEWEAAAAFAGPESRREYPWGDQPEPDPQRAVYDAWQLKVPAPVGLCPAGIAACGALDLAGNVWEWTSSSYRAYPDGAAALEEDFTTNDFDVPLRGGAWWNDSTSVRCGARNRHHPIYWDFSQGLRVVVSPSLAQTS
ncbi:MAG: SUMF1/EgtB/PvdO family nonheme iron enzyme [Oscillochloridaceae bacterium umkhey_bin13]